MRYTLYEDPFTHLFAFLALPRHSADGDELPAVAADQWFGSREEAVAALPQLFDLDDTEPNPSAQDVPPIEVDHPAQIDGVRIVH
jgi:hypothetical protein